jgi:large subunit ribosomal protein L21
MYAIVDIAGQQFKVEPKQRVYVNRLDAKEGDSVELGKVLLLDNNGEVTIGTPLVEGARVAARVLAHIKGDKVIIFKKRRRKGYRKLNGHRQYLTQLFITGIAGKGEDLKLEEVPVMKARVREGTLAPNEPLIDETPLVKAKKSPPKKVVAKKVVVENDIEPKTPKKKTRKDAKEKTKE